MLLGPTIRAHQQTGYTITFQIMMIELNWPWAKWLADTTLEYYYIFFMSWAGKKMFMFVGYK